MTSTLCNRAAFTGDVHQAVCELRRRFPWHFFLDIHTSVTSCQPDLSLHAGLPMTSPRCYSAAFTDDVHQAVCELQRRFPGAPIVAAGYSLGAMLLTKYLAEADSGHWPGEGTQVCWNAVRA